MLTSSIALLHCNESTISQRTEHGVGTGSGKIIMHCIICLLKYISLMTCTDEIPKGELSWADRFQVETSTGLFNPLPGMALHPHPQTRGLRVFCSNTMAQPELLTISLPALLSAYLSGCQNPRHVTQDIVTLHSKTVTVGALHSWSVQQHDHVRLETGSFFCRDPL